MARWSGEPNPRDFLVLSIPSLTRSGMADDAAKSGRAEFLSEFTRELRDELVDAGLIDPDQQLQSDPYSLSPAAEGWSQLFDLTQHIRPLIDDSMRVAFVGGLIWKTVARFRAWRNRNGYNQYEPVVLSESLIGAVVEFRVRRDYAVSGDIQIHLVTIDPYTRTTTSAGITGQEIHFVSILDSSGTTYNFIIDTSGEVIDHYTSDAAEGFRGAVLPSDQHTIQVGSIRTMAWSVTVGELLTECTMISRELEMVDDLRWLEEELSGMIHVPSSQYKWQRFEKATIVLLDDPDEPVYRVVTGQTGLIHVATKPVVVGMKSTHRYFVEFYLQAPLSDLEQAVREFDAGAEDDTPLLKGRNKDSASSGTRDRDGTRCHRNGR